MLGVNTLESGRVIKDRSELLAPLSLPMEEEWRRDLRLGFGVVRHTGCHLTSLATLTVAPATGAPVILTNPERSRVLTGQTGSFSVFASSDSPMSYQWQKGTVTGNMTDIADAIEATYTTPPTTLADHLTLFRCIVSNSNGNATSANELLFVTSPSR